MADGPSAGLALMDSPALTETLGRYHLYHAARADLLRRMGDRPGAAAAYTRALGLVTNAMERAFLEGRLREMSTPSAIREF